VYVVKEFGSYRINSNLGFLTLQALPISCHVTIDMQDREQGARMLGSCYCVIFTRQTGARADIVFITGHWATLRTEGQAITGNVRRSAQIR
jgi:hypothetical protein